jgi:hypothetical protein
MPDQGEYLSSVVTAMATRTVVSLSAVPAAERVPASPAAITARVTDEVFCVLPITPGTRLVSEVVISMIAAGKSAMPMP